MKLRNNFLKLHYRGLLLMILAIFCGLVVGWPLLIQAGTVNLEVGIGTNTTTEGISYYIGMVYRFAAAIVGAVAVIMIVIGGIQYSTAAGSKAAMGSAKETITSAIIGLVIVLMSYLILGVFSSKFTNLSEPTLEPVSVPGQENSGSVHYICGSDQPTPLCHAIPTAGSDDPGCSSYLDGKPCGAINLPDCGQRTMAECAQDKLCQICTVQGTQTCQTTIVSCGTNCQDNCLGAGYRSFCMKDLASCQNACGIFPAIFNNGVCSGCGEKWWQTAQECQTNCGGMSNCQWDAANHRGTCSAEYRNSDYEAAKRACEGNKQTFANMCASYPCGAPAEVNKNGVPDFCCTNP